jgi:hypothetical protein
MDTHILNTNSSEPERPERYQSKPKSPTRLSMSIPVKTQFSFVEVILFEFII